MPIRMVDDPNSQNDDYKDDDNSGGGSKNFNLPGGGGLLSLLPLLLGLFKGKKGIFLLVLIGAGYLIFKSGVCNSLVGGGQENSNYSKGGKLDPNEFKKASVYEGLSDDGSKNPLPEAISLSRFAPPRMNQGKQGSCVAWSSAYAAHTILKSIQSKSDGRSNAFSPAFLYNNIGLDGCQGSYIIRAMEFMTKYGSVPFNTFPYDPNDCSKQPNQSMVQQAQQNKLHGFTRLTEDDGVSNLNLRAIKEHLAKDAPVIIGMMVGGSFMEGMMGQKVWRPSGNDKEQRGFGGHAMCVVGYDDRVDGGAFEIMNSWGPEWGQNGIGFVRYADFKEFVREAYGVDPLPKMSAAQNIDLECAIGLMNTTTKQYIPLKSIGGNVFANPTPIAKGTTFKVELKNSLECYTYIFGQETNQSSYVLFPYKAIHSPYFGVTGYRLFPRKESLMADEVGNKDYMAVVVSKVQLDYNALNTAISNSKQSTYAAKLNEAISAQKINNVQFTANANGTMYFKADASDTKTIVGCIIEINKQ